MLLYNTSGFLILATYTNIPENFDMHKRTSAEYPKRKRQLMRKNKKKYPVFYTPEREWESNPGVCKACTREVWFDSHHRGKNGNEISHDRELEEGDNREVISHPAHCPDIHGTAEDREFYSILRKMKGMEEFWHNAKPKNKSELEQLDKEPEPNDEILKEEKEPEEDDEIMTKIPVEKDLTLKQDIRQEKEFEIKVAMIPETDFIKMLILVKQMKMITDQFEELVKPFLIGRPVDPNTKDPEKK